MPNTVISLDQIMSERAFSVRATKSGQEVLTKISKAPATWNAEARSARFVMTAEITDRYGDIVVTKGGDTTEFEKNPVALWAHDSRDFPIGMWDSLTRVNGSPKRLEGTVTLSDEETTDEADTVFKLLSQGMVRACSIGFMPKAWESIKDEKDRWIGYKFLEWELLECSICSIPANPAALAKAAGTNSGLALQAIELVLDEWARTPAGLIVPRAEYERAYEIVKDKKVTLHEVRAIDEDAPEIEINPLDVEAAVSRALDKAADGIIEKFKKMFGIKDATPEIVPEVETEETAVDPPETVENVVDDVEYGETEDEFQARIAADEAELADEDEEARLRALAEQIAA